MTITSAASEIEYIGDGVTVAFPIPFPFDTSADIKVVRDGAIITTGFTITGGGGSTGTCTFDSAPASLLLITLIDDPEINQDHDYTNNDAFPAESHEQALDRLTRITKRLSARVNRSLRLPDGNGVDSDDIELGPVSTWASKYLAFDADGKPEPAALVSGTISQSIIGALLYPRTAAETAASVTPVNYYREADTPFYDTRRQGALTDNSTDNTAAILASLKAMNGTTTQGGGIVYNPKNSKFNLASITSASGAPARFILLYFGGDDTSDSSTIGTNELRWFIANANASGIVNEDRQESAFHPGKVVNVRKALTMQDPYLGGGQSRTNPARASYNIQDDDIDRARIIYESYNPFSHLSGYRLHSWIRRITLTNIKTTSFVSVPVFGETITGSTSGAKGYLISIDASNAIVGWISGVFQSGESVTDSNETSSTTISSVTVSLLEANGINQDNYKGYVGIGVPGSDANDLLSIGGAAAVGPTFTYGQFVNLTITNPIFKWVDAFSTTANAMAIEYNVSPGAASRRLRTKRQASGTLASSLGMVGAVTAKAAFSNSALVDTSAENIASISRTAVGKYTVTFTTAMIRADYGVALGKSSPQDNPAYKNRTTTTVDIWNYANDNTATLQDLGGEVTVAVICGDI